MVGTAVQRIGHCDDNAMMTTITDDTMMNTTNSSDIGSVSSDGCDGLEVDVAVTLALMVGVLMVSALICLFACLSVVSVILHVCIQPNFQIDLKCFQNVATEFLFNRVFTECTDIN